MSRVIGYDTVLGGASVRPPQTIEYAEAPERPETDLDRAWAWLQGAFVAQGARARARRLRPILRHTKRHAKLFSAMTNHSHTAWSHDFRAQTPFVLFY